jgi:peptidyl-prolyl cis-trans isomerase SurA
MTNYRYRTRTRSLAIVSTTILFAAILAGCDNQPAAGNWPWEKKVPLTTPTAESAYQQSNELAIEATSQPNGPTDSKPMPLSQLAKAPASAPAQKDAPAKISNKPEVVAQSVLQVNDNFVTVEDVLQASRAKFDELPARITDSTFRQHARAIVQETIRDLVNESLVYDEASRRETDDQKKQIDTEVAQTRKDMLAQAGGSKARLEKMLADDGTTLEKTMTEHRRQLVAQRYLHDKFIPVIHVNRSMLWDYYKQHRAEFTTPKMVRMQVLTCSYRPFLPQGEGAPSGVEKQAAGAKAKEQIEKASVAIKRGEDFGQTARKYSNDSKAQEGGLWPLMPAGSFRQAKVEEAAFALEEGQASDIIEADGVYYIVKAAKVQEGAAIDFDQAQVKIEDILKRQQYRKLADEYYGKLVKGAIIVQSDDFVDRCIARAAERYRGKAQ